MSAAQLALKSISSVKISEANRLSENFEDFKVKTLSSGSSLEDVAQLLEECCKFYVVKDVYKKEDVELADSFGSSSTSTDRQTLLTNCQRLLERARLTSNSAHLVEQVRETLVKEIKRDSLELRHGRLLSRQILEMANEKEKTPATRQEQQEQLDFWCELVTKPDQVNAAQVKQYLEKAFSANASAKIGLDKLRRNLKAFSLRIRNVLSFNANSLRNTIKSIISADTLDNNQQATLNEYLKDDNILSELADVLQMRYKNFENWNWQTVNGSVRAFQQRKLNGRYRVYFDYELLDALLWHEIGGSWASQFKFATRQFYNEAWNNIDDSVFSQETLQRRNWFLGDNNATVYGQSVEKMIEQLYSNNYFMSQLPDDRNDVQAYGEDDSDDEDSDKLSFAQRKQALLKLIAADIHTYQFLKSPVAVVCSDFKWFGPSMSYTSIFETLEFFGVDEFWIKMFKRFLNLPFQFDGQPVQHRARGVPVSNFVSDFLTESVLFVMDYAVNVQAQTNVFRMHDDLWVWGSPETALKAWNEITKFSDIFGLELNEEKTGSVCSSSSELEGFPKGDPGCGLLVLNKDLRFVIDTEKFDAHLVELKNQLDSTKSLFNRVKAYNTYAKFLLSNCFTPCKAFGVEHVESIISEFNKPIDHDKSLLDYLLNDVVDRDDWTNAPVGVWYWPIKLGGLELFDPQVSLLHSRENMIINKEDTTEKAELKCQQEYEAIKKRFVNRSNRDYGLGSRPPTKVAEKLRDEAFMPYEEYLQFRRLTRSDATIDLFKGYLYDIYTPYSSPPGVLTDKAKALLTIGAYDTSGPIKSSGNFEVYWQYIVSTFGPDLVAEFGSLQLAKTQLVPLGLARACANERQRWTA